MESAHDGSLLAFQENEVLHIYRNQIQPFKVLDSLSFYFPYHHYKLSGNGKVLWWVTNTDVHYLKLDGVMPDIKGSTKISLAAFKHNSIHQLHVNFTGEEVAAVLDFPPLKNISQLPSKWKIPQALIHISDIENTKKVRVIRDTVGGAAIWIGGFTNDGGLIYAYGNSMYNYRSSGKERRILKDIPFENSDSRTFLSASGNVVVTSDYRNWNFFFITKSGYSVQVKKRNNTERDFQLSPSGNELLKVESDEMGITNALVYRVSDQFLEPSSQFSIDRNHTICLASGIAFYRSYSNELTAILLNEIGMPKISITKIPKRSYRETVTCKLEKAKTKLFFDKLVVDCPITILLQVCNSDSVSKRIFLSGDNKITQPHPLHQLHFYLHPGECKSIPLNIRAPLSRHTGIHVSMDGNSLKDTREIRTVEIHCDELIIPDSIKMNYTWIKRLPSGNRMKTEEQFTEADRHVNRSKEWYVNGQLHFVKRTFSRPKDRVIQKRQDSIEVHWYDNGNMSVKKFFSSEGVLEKTIYWNYEGKQVYLQDLKSGIEKAWYDNGNLYYSGNLKNGLKVGTWKYYYPNGQLFAEAEFQFGTTEAETIFDYERNPFDYERHVYEWEYSINKVYKEWHYNGKLCFHREADAKAKILKEISYDYFGKVIPKSEPRVTGLHEPNLTEVKRIRPLRAIPDEWIEPAR
jgi:antitoxin component YwqK of YwqJK toxin-antitoxin module